MQPFRDRRVSSLTPRTPRNNRNIIHRTGGQMLIFQGRRHQIIPGASSGWEGVCLSRRLLIAAACTASWRPRPGPASSRPSVCPIDYTVICATRRRGRVCSVTILARPSVSSSRPGLFAPLQCLPCAVGIYIML